MFRTYIYLNALTLLSLMVISLACHNDDYSNNIDRNKSELLDSVYLYAKEIYLWNEHLPVKLNYNEEALKSSNMDKLLTTQLIKISEYAINPKTNKSYEYNPSNENLPKYSSFIHIISTKATDINDTLIDNDYGISLCLVGDKDIIVRYVIKGSPADNKGIKRGYKLISINDVPLSITQSYYDYVNECLKSDKIKLELRVNNDIKTHLLFSRKYIPDPILKHTVIRTSNEVIGYIAYLKFTNLTKDTQALDNIIRTFIDQKVNRIIFDLRYNTGGYVSTVDHIANTLIPARYDGEIMRYEQYNATMQSKQAFSLRKQVIKGQSYTLFDIDYSMDNNVYRFKKHLNLEIEDLCFITSNSTASASELLISILKPYMNVKLISVGANGSRTYGKPVGSIGVKIGQYILYLPMFYNLNSNMDCDYWDGIDANYSTYDDVNHDFGEMSEAGLLNSIEYNINDDQPKISSKNINNVYEPHILIK